MSLRWKWEKEKKNSAGERERRWGAGFGKRNLRVMISLALFLCLLLLNCVLFFIQAKGDEAVTVILDPGHGGNDPGKVSATGVKEKDVNLEIALRLKAELQARGYRVVMTREGDDCLAVQGATNKKNSDLRQRMAVIEEHKGDYLISIHQNSYPSEQVSGAQVFYHDSSAEGKALAELVQAEIISVVKPKKERLAKPAGEYYILRKSPCTGILVECGFLSCPWELECLTNGAYQQELARAIAVGFDRYVKEKQK